MLRAISRVTLFFSLCFGAIVSADEPVSNARKRIVTKPKFIEAAAKVPLFAGMEDGSFDATVIAKNAQGGNLFVTNNTEKPLTVEIPEAFVAVNVLKQLGNGNNFFGNNNNNNGIFGNGPGGNQFANGGAGNGASQNIGGGVPGAGGNNGNGGPFGGPFGGNGNNGFFPGGNGNGNGNGNGFFSIPPETTLKVKFVSACLNHGDPEPNIRTKYRVVPVESYTSDTVYHEVLSLVGTGRLSRKAAQAAVWHFSDQMSWDDLANKHSVVLGRRVPYFTKEDLSQARRIVEYAEEHASPASPRQEPTVAQAATRN